MAEPGQTADASEVQVLKAEIVRLNKVVEALMDRSEATMSGQGSDFGLFQATIMLQDQVRLHTEALEATLRDTGAETSSSQEAAARDMQTLRRTAALQIQLLELVVQEKDVGELVERVATILGLPIMLFDARGHIVCDSRSAAKRPDLAGRVWSAYEELQDFPGPIAVIEDGDEKVFFRDIVIMDRIERVLAAVVPRQQSTEFANASLMFLQQLVALDLLHRRDEMRMRRRVRRGLLRDVLAGEGAPAELRVRLEEQGFDNASTLRVTVVEPEALAISSRRTHGSRTASRFGDKLLRAIDAFLSQRRVPFLSLSTGSMAVVLTSFPDGEPQTARDLLGELHEAAAKAAAPERVVVGCSAVLAAVEVAPRCFQQAKAACMAARRAPSAGGSAVFDELSGHLILLDGLDPKALTDIVQRTFAPVLEYDARHGSSLYQTLYTLFEHHLAVQETADVLHIHRNTLQKRVAHVEQLLGVDLNELDDVVDIRLGLQAAALLGKLPRW